MTSGSWTHVAVTLSGTTATTYVNGIPDATASVGIPTSSSVDQTIGSSYTPFYFFDGSIDEVRVYNGALSSADVFQLYAVPEPSSAAVIGVGAVVAMATSRRRSTSIQKTA